MVTTAHILRDPFGRIIIPAVWKFSGRLAEEIHDIAAEKGSTFRSRELFQILFIGVSFDRIAVRK
jgi:hypothetical protein